MNTRGEDSVTTLTIKRLPGNSRLQIEDRARDIALHCYGPGADFTVKMPDDLCLSADALTVDDRYFASSVQVTVVESNGRPEVDESKGIVTTLTLRDLTGHDKQQIVDEALRLARQCFGLEADLQLDGFPLGLVHDPWAGISWGTVIEPDADRLRAPYVKIMAVESNGRPEVDESEGPVTFLTLSDLTGDDKQQIADEALRRGEQCFGPDADLHVEFPSGLDGLRTSDRFHASLTKVMAVESNGRPKVGVSEGAVTVLTLSDLTGDSKREIEEEALRQGEQCFGPDADLRVVFPSGLEDARSAGLRTLDHFCASSVEVVAVEPGGRLETDRGEGSVTVLTLSDLTGDSKREIEEEALRQGEQCFGPDADLHVEFDYGLHDLPPARFNTTDRFCASFVEVVAVESNGRPKVDESEGAVTALTLSDLTGDSKREIEEEALRLGEQCFGPRVPIRVEFRSGLDDARSAGLRTPDRFCASSVKVVAIEPDSRPQVSDSMEDVTVLDLSNVTGDSKREIEEEVLRLGERFFGPRVPIRVEFRSGLDDARSAGLRTPDRFCASSVKVEVAEPSRSLQVDESKETVTALMTTDLTGDSRREIEEEALRVARRFFGPYAALQVVSRGHIGYDQQADKFTAPFVGVEAAEPKRRPWFDQGTKTAAVSLKVHDLTGDSRRQMEDRARLRACKHFGEDVDVVRIDFGPVQAGLPARLRSADRFWVHSARVLVVRRSRLEAP